MSAQTMLIGNRPCRIYGEAHAEYLLFQMTGEHELQSMDDEVAAIAQSNRKIILQFKRRSSLVYCSFSLQQKMR